MALPQHPRPPSGQWWMRARPGGRAGGPSSATSPAGRFGKSNVNLGVVEAHRKVPKAAALVGRLHTSLVALAVRPKPRWTAWYWTRWRL